MVAAALALVALGHGQDWASPGEVITALAGDGDSAFVIREWRLPRVAAALVFGAALGLAGAVFQNLTRNALGSPDVIGLDAGAYTGALVAMTVLNGTAGQLAGGLGGGRTARRRRHLPAVAGLRPQRPAAGRHRHRRQRHARPR